MLRSDLARHRCSRIARCSLLCLLLEPLAVLAEERPNILLLMAEDMSLRVGAFGDSVAVTPNIDQLAAEGVTYTNVFTTAGVCAPSRAAIIMGLQQQSFGAQHMRSNTGGPAAYQLVPPAGAKAFPELLRAAGYHTQVTTKLDYQFSGPLVNSGPSSIWDQQSYGNDLNTRVDKPFFAYMTFMETHESGIFPRWVWPQSLAHLIAQLTHIWYHRGTEDVVMPADVSVPPYYPDSPPIRTDIARHYNNIRTMDLRVGEILAQLERDNLVDSTIVVWTTDHGDALPRAKRELYDSGLHVPMIIRWPEKFRPEGAVAGSVNDRLISLVDLGPTFLSLAGVSVPAGIHGQAFAGEQAQPERNYIYAARDRIDTVADRQRAIRDKQYKYIYSHDTQAGGFRLAYRDLALGMQDLWRHLEAGRLNEVQRQWFSERPREMLFDIESDPHEIRNGVADPAYAAVLNRLRAALQAQSDAVHDDSDGISEAVLAERFWPGGLQPKTASPSIQDDAGRLRIVSDKGASIKYRLDEGPWQLYTGPLSAPQPGRLEARAVRYGWAASDVVGK